MDNAVFRVARGHKRTFVAALVGGAAFAALPRALPWALDVRTRAVTAWDIGAAAFLVLCVFMFAGADPDRMEAHAEAQLEGEWTLFWLVVAGATASFAVILGEFGSMKGASPDVREVKVALVAATLALSWLLTHAVFALRYAHEYYTRSGDAPHVDGGLQFPGAEAGCDTQPDYWDFLYFSAVLGMTFQVSDVQITSRKLRRLATLHGMLGFLFNTVIVALTVNLASGLLS
jgi:uncharacterized membrane protein